MAVLIVMLPVCFADSISLTYDENGNLVTGDGFYREYNSLNQLWKVRNGSDISGNLLQEYTYHPVEERVLIKKSYNNSGDLVETVYYVSDEFVRVVNASGTFDTTYVKHNGQRVAELRPDGSKVFVHSDHLGSTSLVTDESGNAVDNVSYSPFGVVLGGENVSRYSYEGKEYDSVIDQYDFHFRGYKAEWGKFVQPDTVVPNVYDPQQLNRYAFERNNAWRYRDPTGHTLQGMLHGLIDVAVGAFAIKAGFIAAATATAAATAAAPAVLATALVVGGIVLVGIGLSKIIIGLKSDAEDDRNLHNAYQEINPVNRIVSGKGIDTKYSIALQSLGVGIASGIAATKYTAIFESMGLDLAAFTANYAIQTYLPGSHFTTGDGGYSISYNRNQKKGGPEAVICTDVGCHASSEKFAEKYRKARKELEGDDEDNS
ncbi:hypothetical protein KY366_06940 [Candidatus Woesearchaeota archaeon]|nr:hypothetical protein [Candidatus Woesearchaeota archaeon]